MARCDPASKLLWVVNTSVVAAATQSPSQLLLLVALVLVCFLCLSEIRMSAMRNYWRLLVLVPGLLFAFHLLLHPGVVLYHLAFLQITREGLVAASIYSLKLFCSVLAVITFILTTDMRELVASLVRLRVPVVFAFGIYLMLRFVPIMAVEAETVRMGLRTRAPGRQSAAMTLRLWQRYLFTLVLLGVRRAEQTALAMDARGFAISGTRTFLHASSSAVLGAVFLILNVAVSWAIFLGVVRLPN